MGAKFSPIIVTADAVLQSAMSALPAGFPSPADDYLDDPVDLIEQLAPNKMASFLWRIEGRSMEAANINHGDVAIVDRSITPRGGHIVVAVIDGGCTIKRLRYRNGKACLFAEPSSRPPYHLNPGEPFEVWGVVRCTITSHLTGKE